MITISSRQESHPTPFSHHWNLCVGAGRAAEGLRSGWQQQLRMAVAECGFKYIRFHGLFHDDMFVYREEEGRAFYNFQYVDDLFDALLEIGIRPFVEFGFCPGSLAREQGTVFWWKANGSPPTDYAKWEELVRRITSHWVSRYGIDEVRQWYFEVWNEANLNPFFRGTKSEYFELYRVSARAVKSVDQGLRVGGPATSNFVPDARFDGETEDHSCHRTVLEAEDLDALEWKPVWLVQFLDFCQQESLPLDFVSCHPYPTDWALDEHGQGSKLTRGVDATPKDLALLRRMINDSDFPEVEIHLTEWNSSSSPRDFTHDYLQAATYIVRANIASIGTVDSLAYWTFTDIFEEGGAGDTIFHGGFGMINYQGVVKPSYHAYRFLGELGDELLNRTGSSVLTRHHESGKMVALAWHYPDEMTLSVPASFDNRDKAKEVLAIGSDKILKIDLIGLSPHSLFHVELLDRDHGNVMAAWEEFGSPEPPDRSQAAKLRGAARATKKFTLLADEHGVLQAEMKLTPWAVILLKEE